MYISTCWNSRSSVSTSISYEERKPFNLIIELRMSSNRTIVPGMETPYNSTDKEERSDGLIRETVHEIPEGGTFFPGVTQGAPAMPVNNQPSQKPVVGFLYSISRNHIGEYWPLHAGPNTIGQSPSNDICLREATVSEQHATLVVRIMKNPAKVIASICDSQSTNGCMINGESLGFEQKECFNNDILTIGNHYELLLILVDCGKLGLMVNNEFIPTKKLGYFADGDASMGHFPPSASSNRWSGPSDAGVNRTRGFNDDGFIEKGGTVLLPDDGVPLPNASGNNEDNIEKESKGKGRTLFM